jgi:hypothetical protein
MAFLDNSGDIILDAVLTDLGREKMAAGGFTVKYFALGDDEIDYSLYNKNHASGSAYYDLEILQTPIFEAFTQENAAINYGLLTTEATELLYMPVLAINEKEISAAAVIPKASTSGGGTIFWITDDSNDAQSSTTIATVLDGNATIGAGNYMQSTSNNTFVLIESGLNTTQIKGTATNTDRYLSANGLVDSYYYVYYDNRFVSTIYGPQNGNLTNTDGASNGAVRINNWITGRASSIDLGLENHSAVRVKGLKDQIYYDSSNTVDDTSISAIAGPRGNFTALSFGVKTDLGDEYSLFGSDGTINDGSSDVDVQLIDTTIYVQGMSSGATLQIPLRIVRLKV